MSPTGEAREFENRPLAEGFQPHDNHDREIREGTECDQCGRHVLWRGYLEDEVEVFDLTGHPTARTCYGWSYDDNGTNSHHSSSRPLPPVDSAETAVKVGDCGNWKNGKTPYIVVIKKRGPQLCENFHKLNLRSQQGLGTNTAMESAMAMPLEKEFQYYLDNQDELVRKYNGRCVVIKDCQVIGVFDDELSAVKEIGNKHPLGTFLVQKVEPGSNAYSQTFHSRVAIV